MDEPSAALSGPDTDRLHEIVRDLCAAGKTIILISHFLDEVLALADTVTVLRDGRVVETRPAAECDRGVARRGDARARRSRPHSRRSGPLRADAPTVLSVRNLVARGVAGASLEVRSGEIVGLAGLVGAGRTELARAIFGADPVVSGEVLLEGGRARRQPAAEPRRRRRDDP